MDYLTKGKYLVVKDILSVSPCCPLHKKQTFKSSYAIIQGGVTVGLSKPYYRIARPKAFIPDYVIDTRYASDRR